MKNNLVKHYILLTDTYHKIGEFATKEEAFAYADWLDGDNIIEAAYYEADTEWELD